jgi:hypothetical protein
LRKQRQDNDAFDDVHLSDGFQAKQTPITKQSIKLTNQHKREKETKRKHAPEKARIAADKNTRTMNPIMMIPHKYKYRKTHPDNDPKTTTTTIRYSNVQNRDPQRDSQQLYCHSPSPNPKLAWTKDVKSFVQSGHEDLEHDGLYWCE